MFNVQNLNHAIVVNALEGDVKKRYMLNEKVDIVNQDTVTDIIWVLDKDKDARIEKLLSSDGDGKTDSYDLGANGPQIFRESFFEEGG